MKINLKNTNGALISAPTGFSWTTFFFGFFVPIFRGSAKWFAIMLVLQILSLGFANLVFCFIFNKIWIKELLEKGYIPADDYSKSYLQQKGLFVK